MSRPSAWTFGDASLRREALLEEFELLVQGRLGRLHQDEAVDEALAVGLDAFLEVGDLGVDLARLLGQGVLTGNEGAIFADGVVEIRAELRRNPVGGIVEEGLEAAEVVGDGGVEGRFVLESQQVVVAGGVDADLGQGIEHPAQPGGLVEGDATELRGDLVGIGVAGEGGPGDLAGESVELEVRESIVDWARL